MFGGGRNKQLEDQLAALQRQLTESQQQVAAGQNLLEEECARASQAEEQRHAAVQEQEEAARTNTELEEAAQAAEAMGREISQIRHEMHAGGGGEGGEGGGGGGGRAGDGVAPRDFLDVSIGECEFANAFIFSLTVQLRGKEEHWSTDISATPSSRPTFQKSSFLLPSEAGVAAETVSLSAFVHIADPAALPDGGATSAAGTARTARLLGDAQIPLSEIAIPEGASMSRRVTRVVSFVRSTSQGAGIPGAGTESRPQTSGAQQLIVGRTTVTLQAKVLTPAEIASSGQRPSRGSASPLPASYPSLDRSLWLARPFQHRWRALVHQAHLLPSVAPGNTATVRVAFRFLSAGGQVLHESNTTDVPVVASGPAEAANIDTAANFDQELVLPVPPGLQDLTVQLSLEMMSAEVVGAGMGGATSRCLLNLQWRPDSLPPLFPLHLLARPSQSGPQAPFGRPRPSLLVSLLHEPSPQVLDELSGGASFGTEVRIHGVAEGRPLPDPIEGAFAAVCIDEAGARSTQSEAPKIPVCTYNYDQRMELAACMEAYAGQGQALPKYFLTPMLGQSRVPSWGSFVVRCLASFAALTDLTVLVFQRGEVGQDVEGTSLAGPLLGFATVNAAALANPAGSSVDGSLAAAEPLQRSFQPDMRLLAAPGAAASLELEVRVWPRGAYGSLLPGEPGSAGGSAIGVPKMSVALQAARRQAMGTSPGLLPTARDEGFALMSNGSTAAAMQHEAHELRLNHEISVQLAKEFNMRAAALKKAGEEIVELRRQVQLLRNENAQLKAQVEEEEKLVQDIKGRPLPEGLESLGAPELLAKLQRAVEKYRDEKAKGVELVKRVEEAAKEAARGRGLERSLSELERAHLEQNRELQRLQEENRKMDAYRQTAHAQEKVIGKLEKLLEASLQEVQKSQRVQVDVDKMRAENLRIRERIGQLSAQHDGGSGGSSGSEELHRQVLEKSDEVLRLQALVGDLRRSGAQRSEAAVMASPHLQRERRDLQEQEDKVAEWAQRCQAAEDRLQGVQQQLVDSSKRYGAEIQALRVEVAKKDAQVLELEVLLGKGRGRGDGGGHGGSYIGQQGGFGPRGEGGGHYGSPGQHGGFGPRGEGGGHYGSPGQHGGFTGGAGFR